MNFTVLGKYGAVPAKNGATSSYLVENGESKILLDCGSGALSRLQNYCKIEDLDAIILSHLHSDHMCDMLLLRYYLEKKQKHIPVYLPFVKCPEYELLAQCEYFSLNPIIEGISAQVLDVKINFFGMKHKAESYATRLEADGRILVYSGDTSFNENIMKSIKGAHAYLCDCAVPSAEHTAQMPHMSVSEGIMLAKQENIKLYITHQFAGQSVRQEAKTLYNNAVVVSELTTYKV